MAKRALAIGVVLTCFSGLFGAKPLQAGFRSPESVVRNVYGFYGDRTSDLSSGLPRDPDTARQFFDLPLQQAWVASKPPFDFMVQAASWKLGAVSIAVIRRQFDKTYVTATFTNSGRKVVLNFIVIDGPDGWVIADVESPHDSLRLFLAQHSK
jgi:hypothetical protein